MKHQVGWLVSRGRKKYRDVCFCEEKDQTKVEGMVLKNCIFFRCKSIPKIITLVKIQTFKKLSKLL